MSETVNSGHLRNNAMFIQCYLLMCRVSMTNLCCRPGALIQWLGTRWPGRRREEAKVPQADGCGKGNPYLLDLSVPGALFVLEVKGQACLSVVLELLSFSSQWSRFTAHSTFVLLQCDEYYLLRLTKNLQFHPTWDRKISSSLAVKNVSLQVKVYSLPYCGVNAISSPCQIVWGVSGCMREWMGGTPGGREGVK